MLGLEVDGQRPGGMLTGSHATRPVQVSLRAPFPVDRLELVQNGRIVRQFKLSGARTAFDWQGDVKLASGGWVLLRAYNEKPDPWVLDLYPYATTSPIYFEAPPPPAPEDASYFAAWMDRVVEATLARGGWNSEKEKSDTLAYLNQARDKFRALAGSQTKD